MTNHEFAKQLRSHQTAAEERLWYFLRARRFLGLKFKRQKPVGPYIADFICMEHKLIVEADGGQHGSLRDFDRDIWLREQGYTVLRVWNNEIHDQIEGVLEAIRQAALANGLVEPLAPSPNSAANAVGVLPSPASGRGAGGEGEPATLPTTCRRSHTP
ncbi:endonuclease domain-containing protein [Cupriavidus sp. U2]|uniref:endonuclease domain-containing protein n=1 Tax=Cupriavidus sp. U2 TaxID=2920269 RepID=UPI00129EA3DF|nr:endonuclease domain-containing protein [Cupriavidus sp. U2]